ncbi:MAG: hydroxyethylthiazole kinase [Lachnospiraceae bacterium]
MFQSVLEAVRQKKPLIHSITNYVTANDCANILLACGASPIMADDPAEAEEITASCDGLVLNLGTLSRQRLDSMLLAGKTSNTLCHPIVFDPVGAGISQFRTDAAQTLLARLHFSVIRGNLSEIKALTMGSCSSRGVDAGSSDNITEQNLEKAAAFAKTASRKLGAVVAITGMIDLVSDETTTYCIKNGHPLMASVTGTGCQLSALTAAFAASFPDDLAKASAAAVCAMGLAGETAARRMGPQDGNVSYRTYLIDAVFNMTPEILEKGANYEMR